MFPEYRSNKSSGIKSFSFQIIEHEDYIDYEIEFIEIFEDTETNKNNDDIEKYFGSTSKKYIP